MLRGKHALDTEEGNEKKHRGQLERSNNERNPGHPAGSAGRNRRVVETAPPGGTRSAEQREHPVLSKWAERLVHCWGGHQARFSEDRWLANAPRTR